MDSNIIHCDNQSCVKLSENLVFHLVFGRLFPNMQHLFVSSDLCHVSHPDGRSRSDLAISRLKMSRLP
jgi:hypothetical protein